MPLNENVSVKIFHVIWNIFIFGEEGVRYRIEEAMSVSGYAAAVKMI
jgi:hypothetical protein